MVRASSEPRAPLLEGSVTHCRIPSCSRSSIFGKALAQAAEAGSNNPVMKWCLARVRRAGRATICAACDAAEASDDTTAASASGGMWSLSQVLSHASAARIPAVPANHCASGATMGVSELEEER